MSPGGLISNLKKRMENAYHNAGELSAGTRTQRTTNPSMSAAGTREEEDVLRRVMDAAEG
jgi:hypothetical protein